MSSLHAFANPEPTTFATVTSALLNSASAVETHVTDLVQRHEQRERYLLQQLEQGDRELATERQRLNAAYRWLLLIRRSHRRDSHRATGHIVRDAVRELTTTTTPRSPIKYHHRCLRITS
jgi:hypothetical protein